MFGQYVVIYQQNIDQSSDLTFDMHKEKKADETKFFTTRGNAQIKSLFHFIILSLGFPWPSLTFNHSINFKSHFYY